MFKDRERLRQINYFKRPEFAGALLPDTEYKLLPGKRHLNFSPVIAKRAVQYFEGTRNISWHPQSDHCLSSQGCCLNFLMPLADRPYELGKVLSHALGLDGVEPLPIDEGYGDETSYVAFEWAGAGNLLDEARGRGTPKRGSNSTSVDAMVHFLHKGRKHIALIEWKYAENDTGPVEVGTYETRLKRYGARMFCPDGPLKQNASLTLHDFLYHPFYQLLRQQILAWQMQRMAESNAERVMTLHISPRPNSMIHRVSSPRFMGSGHDAYEVFRSLLTNPEDFVTASTEDVFLPILKEYQEEPWAAYLLDRYQFLTDPQAAP